MFTRTKSNKKKKAVNEKDVAITPYTSPNAKIAPVYSKSFFNMFNKKFNIVDVALNFR